MIVTVRPPRDQQMDPCQTILILTATPLLRDMPLQCHAGALLRWLSKIVINIPIQPVGLCRPGHTRALPGLFRAISREPEHMRAYVRTDVRVA